MRGKIKNSADNEWKEEHCREGKLTEWHAQLKVWNDERNVEGLDCFTRFEHEPISHELRAENIEFFLKSVHLEGFKSIKNVEIDFESGLNIIIGTNGAGKSNFIDFLQKSLTLDFSDLIDFKSKFSFNNKLYK